MTKARPSGPGSLLFTMTLTFWYVVAILSRFVQEPQFMTFLKLSGILQTGMGDILCRLIWFNFR